MLLTLSIGLLPHCVARADTPGPATQPAAAPSGSSASQQIVENVSAHAQATVITQKHDVFAAKYTFPGDIPPREGYKTSVTGTLFLGARLPWSGGEIYFNPELSGGEGFGGVFGAAGFPNGEIPRVGTPEPEPYVARGFIRQTFGLGGEREHVEDGQNQIAGFRDVNRLTVTFGKVAATDLFDNNNYSHDPRSQFENWALMDNGAWDYPADTRGYSVGLTAELNGPTYTWRYGAFAMPKQANGATFDWNIPKALGHALELEERWVVQNRGGAVRLLTYVNTAHMGNYRQAVDHPGPRGVDITLSRTYDAKYGFGISVEQAITDDLGLFGRIGWNDGHTESFVFTEIDRTGSIGLSLRGSAWHRPDDVVALAGVINGLAKDHRDYLGAGGRGIIIGDGRLPHYATEQIIEAYYLYKLADHIFITADFQLIDHAAYTSDRGPILIGGLRGHIEF